MLKQPLTATRAAWHQAQAIAAERAGRATRSAAELRALASSLRQRVACWELTRDWLQDDLNGQLEDLRRVSTWPRTAQILCWLADAHRARRAIALDLATAARMVREARRWLAELEEQGTARPRPTASSAADDRARRVDLPACAGAHHLDQP